MYRESIMHRRVRGWVGIALVSLLAVSAVLWMVVDQGLMTRRSEHFTRETFAEVEKGMPLAEAVVIVGPPVRSEKIDPVTRLNPAADSLHYFSVPAVDWWPIYTQAWVVTDRNEVIVVVAITEEP